MQILPELNRKQENVKDKTCNIQSSSVVGTVMSLKL